MHFTQYPLAVQSGIIVVSVLRETYVGGSVGSEGHCCVHGHGYINTDQRLIKPPERGCLNLLGIAYKEVGPVR